MFRNHILTAWRNIIRNQEYSIINVAGLAVSIASSLILFYIIQYELSFDAFHSKKDRIYRISNEVNYPEGMDYGMGIPAPLPEAMRLDFPQLEQVATIFSIPGSQIDVLAHDDQRETKFTEELGVFFAEPEFFKIFDFQWIHGSAESLNEPNTVVLTQQAAEKYFGNWHDAIGKEIEYRNSNVLKVTGILANIPAATDFPLKVVMSWKTRGPETQTWGGITSRRQCYILLDEQTSPDQIAALMPAFEKKHHPEGQNVLDHYTLQPLKTIHFDERYGNFNNRIVSTTTLWSLGIIAMLLIVTASINFVNLATSQVMKRSKEVGIRKVLGSNRAQLSAQFFGEALFLVTIASLLALAITPVLLPSLQTLLNLPETFKPADVTTTLIFIATVIIIVTLFSGLYPARILGSFKPAQALKSSISNQRFGGLSFRKRLVVAQFGIAQILVIATLIMFQQIDFFRNTPLGFDKTSSLLMPIPTDSLNQTKIEAFRNELMRQPEITNVAFMFTPPLSQSNRRVRLAFDHSTEETSFEINVKYADPEYFRMYNLELAAGRVYLPSDTPRECVVNEAFLEKFGITNPEDGIGKNVTNWGLTIPVVGVLKDYHLLSLQEKIEPLIMICNKAQYGNAGVRFETDDINALTKQVETTYRSFFPESAFEYHFLDESVARMYANEERLSSITWIFSAIAIFISSLGLYGLISFMAVQRTKEVGIRKALGASVRDIVVLFYKEFIFLSLIAYVVAAPLTGYFMSGWLNRFAYRVEVGPWIFVVAIVLSVLIAAISISFQSIKAALANPVDSLRSE